MFDRAQSLLFKWTAGKFVVLVLGSVSLSAAYAVAAHEMDEKRVRDTLVQGTCPQSSVKSSYFVDRPSVESDFVRMVTPQEDPASYFVVVGEHGTGKSTMMKAACSKVGGGVIYVDVPANVRNFGDAFAHAIGFKFHPSHSFAEYIHSLVYGTGPSPEQHQERWELPYEKFKELARWYRATHGKTPVIVFDSVNFLAKDAEKVLEVLQRDAKVGIDEHLFVAVFTSSDGLAPTQMESRSAFSRGESYRVGDLDDEQVKEFLTKRKECKPIK
ncbi:hypothetical protein HDU98_002085 [Podochytrium sp. JEL0797]|nr:hypothetical protein HDU98_002085 [Podochytrium sp. JEL0797]